MPIGLSPPCTPSPCLAYPDLSTHPSRPLVGCANGAARHSLFHRSVLGPHEEDNRPRQSPTKGKKIRNGCLTPAFSGAQKRAEMRRHPCILMGPQRQARGSKSSKLIHGQFHIGAVHKSTICGGNRPKKVRIVTKIGGKGCIWGIRYIKIACVYVPLYCLYSRIITQTVCCRARRRRRRISTPIGPELQVDTPYRQWGTRPKRQLWTPGCPLARPLSQRGQLTNFRLSNPALSPPCGKHIMCPHPHPLCPWCVYCVSVPLRGMGAIRCGAWWVP